MEGQIGQQEFPDPVEPRIYAASLSDYNNGRLHGRWIKAAQTPQRIYEEIHRMLATSPSPDAEEWAIHDYEGFDPLHLSENESLNTVSQIAIEISQHRSTLSTGAQN